VPENIQEFSLTLNIPEGSNVNTFLGFSIIASTVAGLRPLRADFSSILKLPNPMIGVTSADEMRYLLSQK